MDNRGGLLFLLIAFYLLLSSQTRPPLLDQDHEHQREIARERDALQLLNQSKYGDFEPLAGKWLPSVPGLRNNDSYAWELIPDVQQRVRRQLHSALLDAGRDVPQEPDDLDLSSLNLTQLPLPVYRNVTGKLKGDWVRLQIDRPLQPLNFSAIAQEHDYITYEFGLNITGDSGTFYLGLHEGGGQELRLGDGPVREMRAELAVESDNVLGTTHYLSLYGVHFPETGATVLSTSTEKFFGLLALPHFTMSRDTFDLSQRLLVKSLSDAILEKRHRHPTLFPWSSLAGAEMVDFPAPKCEHIVYLQQHPVVIQNDLADKTIIEQIEEELRFPLGAPIPPPPLMVTSAVVFSPDCGYILETKSAPDFPPSEGLYLKGPKQEEFAKYASRFVYVICAMFSAQIALLLRQIKESSTPSTRSRVSFYTIAFMAFGDAFTITFVLLELYAEVSFLVLTAASFLALLSVSIIGMKFMMDIWAVQIPERQEQGRQANPRPSNADQPSLPLAGTAPRPTDTGATPVVILTPDQDPPMDEDDTPPIRDATQRPADTRADVGAMFARFYFALFALIILTLWSFIWPNRLGAWYARTLGFVYLSFWVPQIHRNVMRNCRKALRWDFVIGQSILRLFPFSYFLTVRGNVLFVRPDWTTALAMAGWVWIQVWLLASQDVLGPRFFVPRGWAPPAYDYHPILRDTSGTDGDLESGGALPVGLLRAEERDVVSEDKTHDKQRTRDKKKAVFDCAICMQEIEVPLLAAPGSAGASSVADGASTILSRRTYMVTPCRHIFHSGCLESWMRLRLQCPICRETIPPV